MSIITLSGLDTWGCGCGGPKIRFYKSLGAADWNDLCKSGSTCILIIYLQSDTGHTYLLLEFDINDSRKAQFEYNLSCRFKPCRKL